MKNTFSLDFSTIVAVAAVHAIGGIGLGMWLSEQVPVRRRRAVALVLMGLGAALHVPMKAAVMRGRNDRTALPSSGTGTLTNDGASVSASE